MLADTASLLAAGAEAAHMLETRNGAQQSKPPRETMKAQFLRLFLENEKRIFGFILALVPHWTDAEDVFQETSRVLWDKFDAFAFESDFLAWALTIARFQVLCYRKKRQRSRVRFSDQTIEALADRLTTFLESSDQCQDALSHCLALLGDRDRELIQLRYTAGATTPGVAATVGRSVHAAYKALNRIHTRLLLCMRRYLQGEEA
jgi:RNA polymerase sigma-70 factor (ECF subfamily)